MSHLSDQDLQQLLDGDVTEQKRVEINTHLAECTDCREWAGEAAEVLDELRAQDATPFVSPDRKVAPNPASWKWIVPIVAAAALASILILKPFGESPGANEALWSTIASADVPSAPVPVRVRAATGNGSFPSVSDSERYFWLGTSVTDLERARRQNQPNEVIDLAQTIRQLLAGPIETQPIVSIYEAIQSAAEDRTLSSTEAAGLNLEADQLLRDRIGNPHYALGRELEWLRLQISAGLSPQLPTALSVNTGDARAEFSSEVLDRLGQLEQAIQQKQDSQSLDAIQQIRREYGG